jgi:hypothetical protein
MPWTFAHPAAVLPLRRLKRLSFGALVTALPVAYFLSTKTHSTNIALFVVRYVMSCTTIFAVTLSAASLWIAHRRRGTW